MTKEERRSFWAANIAQYRASGLSGKVWSNENNLSVHALRYWIHKFNKEDEPSDIVEFKPIVIESPSSIEPSIKVTIGTAVIELTKGFDEIAFERVAAILSRQC